MKVIFSLLLVVLSPLALSETLHGHIRSESGKWLLRPFGKNATAPIPLCGDAVVQKYKDFYIEAVLSKDAKKSCFLATSVAPAIFDPLKESLRPYRPKK
jgi:hypothetical protein